MLRRTSFRQGRPRAMTYDALGSRQTSTRSLGAEGWTRPPEGAVEALHARGTIERRTRCPGATRARIGLPIRSMPPTTACRRALRLSESAREARGP